MLLNPTSEGAPSIGPVPFFGILSRSTRIFPLESFSSKDGPMRVLLHALLASDVIKATSSLASSSSPLPQLRAVSPQVHLDNFLRHSSSPASSASSVAAVTARPMGANDCSWELVGAVSSCAAPSEGDIASGRDFNECALFAAVQVQQRLISEHACRIHHHLRAWIRQFLRKR